ncbi:1-acyl-sn-glycerol-3-phosphate acyltransferase [Maribacter vaceletii]|uniref:1-acyl-sn-glycerol-3-phosphate acyltransferase n=1 Tax=Maribacter vaceletii TaxID=1206816 RepID=A0A495DWT8_9FLAO|nr:1-acyl-sn-glycerol-3-phosphate acyltransferase [Maribacter vaceletii]RKR08077.1 1-acyl-sn-glycerol-3-phosphate acyltransferase [Maribacter vaceletii]
MHKIAKFIYFKLLGWKTVGDFPQVNKCVIAVVPHTSWVDFFLGLLIRKVWNEEINYVGKKALFNPPFGWFFRWTGGAPVDRTKNNNMVSATAEVFKTRKKFRLTLAPEGTRKKVTEWKTGFYFIAIEAKVPIVLVAFDFGKKQVKISKPYTPTGNKEKDFKSYAQFFEGVKGKVEKYSY